MQSGKDANCVPGKKNKSNCANKGEAREDTGGPYLILKVRDTHTKKFQVGRKNILAHEITDEHLAANTNQQNVSEPDES